jgi:hypothetical protein
VRPPALPPSRAIRARKSCTFATTRSTRRDFDLSPYFRIVKPTLEYGFDYRAVTWDDKAAEPETKAAE